MPHIDDYYQEFVQIMLDFGNQRRPLILLVDKEYYAKEDAEAAEEDPDDMLPDVLSMFPEDSEVIELETGSWLKIGLADTKSSISPLSEETAIIRDRISEETAICVVLPMLNLISVRHNESNRNFFDTTIWNAFSVLLDFMPPGAKMLIPVPIRILRLPGFAQQRQRMFEEHRAFIVEHEDPYSAIRFRMTAGFSPDNMATIVLWKEKGPVSFYRLTKADLTDFRHRIPLLLSRKAEKVKDGFVYNGALDLHKPTLFSSYDPDRRVEVNEDQALSDFADVLRGPRLGLVEGGSKKCLTHTCITQDLVIDTKLIIRVEHEDLIGPEMMLQSGDILLSSQTDPLGRLLTARLDAVPATTLFDDSLIVIRFKPEVQDAVKELVLTILQSPAAARIIFLDGEQPSHDLDLEWVKSMRLPIDVDTIAEYHKLCEMRDRFSSWTARTEELIQGLLLEDSPDSIRHRIQRQDKKIRLISQAGRAVMNLDHRIARYYPRPISFVWAEHRASVRSDSKSYYERLAKVRKAGETLVASLALIAASYVRYLGKDAMGAGRLSRKPDRENMGVDFGTWKTILGEACLKLAKLGDGHLYIPEFGEFVKDRTWQAAVDAMIGIRNEDSHLRLSNAELVSKVTQAEAHLRLMFERVAFLTDWSLRIIDSDRWDSRTEVSTVTFRELHGTSIFAETQSALVSDARLEIGSLYLVNKLGKQHWHLLRPFFLFLECPDHHVESIFHLDSLSRDKRRPGNVLLRSFEFNSTRPCSQFNGILRESGLME